ncbi:MAG: hypothetical protein AAFY11_06775 [Cyanobacteria bacterium J06641_5]
MTLSLASADTELGECRAAKNEPEEVLGAKPSQLKKILGTQPYYALREINGEIVVDLCEVRGLEQHIIRASYLRAPNAMVLRAQLNFYPRYPIASTVTPTLRCRAHLNNWPL